jgi:hypothetical protein
MPVALRGQKPHDIHAGLASTPFKASSTQQRDISDADRF